MPRQSSNAWQRIARRIRVPVGFVFTVLYVWLANPTGKSILFGTVFVVTGVAVRAASSGHLEKNEQLATTGPYSYTRNPLYLGSLILALGFAIASLNWWIVLVTGMIFAALYIPVIQAEEAFLRTRFPEFAGYAHAVPRILPRLRPFSRSSGGFSLDLYLKHREYNASLGSAVLIATLIAKLIWRLHHPAGGMNAIF